VPLRALTEEDVQQQQLPTAHGIVDESDAESEVSVPDVEFKNDWIDLDQDMIVLSTLPKSKWHNLLHLDSIKVIEVD
jgi:hypothetical protein